MQNYYDDGSEEKEELLSFKADELLGDEDNDDSDQWVATHTGGSRGE
jgi:hypothetical protein